MKKFDFYRLHLVNEGLYVKLSRRTKIYRILNAICEIAGIRKSNLLGNIAMITNDDMEACHAQTSKRLNYLFVNFIVRLGFSVIVD
jgi:hypothetical protein